ncbi:MAG: hypothetical protein RLN87_15075 [Parasphingopyxis sp.]|uniref:hypothetical protein n=1 Tax=Parasphingopyxis sp. TaxID=1920299 RepID=UPI00262E6587|nr:hypothetical protein [uncultured Parasphingopyxis sp.]
MSDTAKPKPTAMELVLIVVGAAVGAAVGFGFLAPQIEGIAGSAIAGGITGLGAVLGALPYSRRVQAWQKAQKG